MNTQVMVVEDEAIVAESIASKLRKFGYSVSEPLPTGEEAVKAAGQLRPDVILMDIHLAGEMDGISAACQISERFHIPVIFLTAYADDQTLDRAREAGPFGYLVKPFRERDLHTTIEMAWERNRLQNELETANRELDSFSYSVSHDLRAPIIAIDGFSRILEENYGHLLPDDGNECIARIRQAASHMDRLIADFLRLSRVSRAVLVYETIDLTAQCRKILNELTEQEPDRDVTWHVDEDMKVVADPGLMEIVLSNLIGNAWKYTKNTQKTLIDIGLQKQDSMDVFYVKDNGAGFSMDDATKLFMPLQRLHSQQEFPGNGIGLATVKRVIQRHGGKIWADAKEGVGATFFFTIGEEASS